MTAQVCSECSQVLDDAEVDGQLNGRCYSCAVEKTRRSASEGGSPIFEVGDSVMWRGGWGTEPAEPAVITGFGENNGRAVADLDNGHWAYLSQLEKVNLPRKGIR